MATTTTLNQPTPATRTNKKAIYWGFAVAIIIVLAIAFAARSPRVNDAMTPPPATSSTVDTTTPVSSVTK